MRAIKHYLILHLQSSLNSLGQFSRNPFNCFMTCLIIGIALALPMGLFILLKNVETASLGFKQTSHMTLYLKKEVNEKNIPNLVRDLKNTVNISDIHVISPAQALKELDQGFLTDFDNNPLPWAIVVTPRLLTDTALKALTDSLKKYPEVANIQMDILWIKRLQGFLTLAERLVYLLTAFLIAAVLLIVYSAIRSATQNNQKEIEIMKLIGGTHAFIRRPFLYTGILYGFLGGIIAWHLIDSNY